jgi:hypothetical protein
VLPVGGDDASLGERPEDVVFKDSWRVRVLNDSM